MDKNYFEYLPFEIVVLILKKLDKQNRLKCKLVCADWLNIMMTCVDFKNDRSLIFKHCYYESNRLPVAIFNNLSYNTYFCKYLIVNSYNCNIDFDNIPQAFWSILENDSFFLTLHDIDDKIVFYLLNRILSKCKITGLRFFNYSHLIDFSEFVKHRYPLYTFNTIERLKIEYIKNNFETKLLTAVTLLFPNLKSLSYGSYDVNVM